MSIESNLHLLARRWADANAAERANAQLYLTELCEALEVERPRPAGAGYEFEYPVKVVNRDGTETTNFVDLYKRDHFVLEAKDEAAGKPTDVLLRKAFGQARSYAAAVAGTPPPYLMVLDVGQTLLVWDRWSGTYGSFSAGRRVHLPALAERPEDFEWLRNLWEHPEALDPRAHAAAVTKEIAARLGTLAGALERRGHEPEQVAKFLIRCVFTMFAEDVGLLPEKLFAGALEVGLQDPTEFAGAIEELWEAMDQGKRFGLRKLLRFNGHFFQEARALPVTREDLAVLHEATQADWADVEPSIFGTLLTRALDPAERHRLGAEYTPPSYIERLVRPTIEEPVRERWTGVQAEVLQLLDEEGKGARKVREDRKSALERLREYHGWLRGLRVLDPACGSGNFLYLAMHALKRVELEVLREIEDLTGNPELAVEEVGPWQFYGLEIKPWARELAELTLWIGYHQWWRRVHGHTQPPEPILKDTHTLERRDAVLAWERIEEDPERSRPDPTPRLRHPVTGELVPDPDARLPYLVHVGAHQAEWPAADFIIGNPPYLGRGRQRDALGDGYVDALRTAYPNVPDNADYVMYWWHRAARAVASGRTMRAGLITTNTITQRHNREVIESAAEVGAHIAWTVPDHPWVDEAGAANVRVAMTVVAKEPERACRVEVDDEARVVREIEVERLNADLTAHADVATAAAVPLVATSGLSSQGFTLVGEGFRLSAEEGDRLLAADSRHAQIVKRIVNGRDLTQRSRGIYTIDFGLRDEHGAREIPVLYGLVRDRVKPGRDANNDRSTRENWWRFGRNREQLRDALEDLERYIVTVETSRHRFFQFLPVSTAAEHSVVCIALEDAFSLGVLSSRVHVAWALAAGGRLGVGNDARYQKAMCFDPFPFPDASPDLRGRIADVAESIDRHRRDAIARDERVTMTAIYNVIEKLRSRDPLTPNERAVHESAACGVLLDLHEELDRMVAIAYGWTWPLEPEEILTHLVELHGRRVAEERAGEVRWLRPDYQIPRFGKEIEAKAPTLEITTGQEGGAGRAEPERWPALAWEQILALQSVLAKSPATVEEAASCFRGARRDLVGRHLETLALMGEARRGADGAYHLVREAA